ncbi:BnaCnng29930D [Brassica napus]|uniref:BnaCnng29930D protein n=1 Tax=Brassica napus TaxID=3708 RepID=A0A078J294_BRANA|nr:BnaCnng29930D [Brassica napus]
MGIKPSKSIGKDLRKEWFHKTYNFVSQL